MALVRWQPKSKAGFRRALRKGYAQRMGRPWVTGPEGTIMVRVMADALYEDQQQLLNLMEDHLRVAPPR